MASVFLYAPQDFHNLCMMARTLEVFGEEECHVFDPNRLLRERYGKSRARELRAVSAGAFEKIRWVPVAEPEPFLAMQSGRVVATVAASDSKTLTQHEFRASDWLLFGSESRGLPPQILALCAAKVTIPMRGRTQSLNLAVALGIALFERQRQCDLLQSDPPERAESRP